MSILGGNMSFRAHGCFAGMSAASGAIAGGVFLGSSVAGAMCGIARYSVDLIALETGVLGRNADKVSKLALGIVRGLVTLGVLTLTGVLVPTIAPINLVGFVVLNIGLQWVFAQIFDANRERVSKCLFG